MDVIILQSTEPGRHAVLPLLDELGLTEEKDFKIVSEPKLVLMFVEPGARQIVICGQDQPDQFTNGNSLAVAVKEKNPQAVFFLYSRHANTNLNGIDGEIIRREGRGPKRLKRIISLFREGADTERLKTVLI